MAREAIEDLTGGVTTELFTSDILDLDEFWNDELSKVNEEFLFGCATGFFDTWKGRQSRSTDRKGVIAMHAYSIMEAREEKGLRLLKVRYAVRIAATFKTRTDESQEPLGKD